MSRITTADIRAFTRKRLDTGAAAAEVNRELAILKRMFTLAIKGNRLLVRPHIPMLAENNVRKGFFEREQFEACTGICLRPFRPLRRSRTLLGGEFRARSCRSSGAKWI